MRYFLFSVRGWFGDLVGWSIVIEKVWKVDFFGLMVEVWNLIK